MEDGRLGRSNMDDDGCQTRIRATIEFVVWNHCRTRVVERSPILT